MFTASIRWRLQIWLGILLVGLLAAFGTTAWQLEKTQRLGRLDDQLAKHVATVGATIQMPAPMQDRGRFRGRPGPGGPGGGPGGGPRGGGRQPNDWPDGGGRMGDFPEFREESLPAAARELFKESSPEGFYYVVWTGWTKQISKSVLAPETVPLPDRGEKNTQARFRDRQNFREAYYFTERGDCILAGRPVDADLSAMRAVALRLTLTGLGVLALGLGGGWWLTARSIRPIEDIAAAARRISENNLSERIPAGQQGSELGALADVLNTTFARLEDSFSQQKRFTSDASHELRTPLTVLISETQTALSRDRSTDEYREVLAGNLDTARQMKRLAEALLELARLDNHEEALGRTIFDLSLVAREVVGRLKPLAAAKSISLDLDLKAALIEGSPDRFGLVISNLVENAIHYGRYGGTISVTVGARDGASVLEVSDNGQGISEDDLPHIFERFYRADKSRSRSGGRYGLGLAICRGMVEADGGTIGVTSTLGQGSTFVVRFPVIEEQEHLP